MSLSRAVGSVDTSAEGTRRERRVSGRWLVTSTYALTGEPVSPGLEIVGGVGAVADDWGGVVGGGKSISCDSVFRIEPITDDT